METKVKKNQTAKVGEKYSYKYVDIAQIHDYLEEINSRYIQRIERIDGDDYVMTKRCFDNKWEDEWLQGCRVVQATLVGVNNPAQQQGSALTYARRYSLLMAYGLATEDDDAQSLGVEAKKANPTKEDAENFVFAFGKHAKEKLGDVVKNDSKYIDWYLYNGNDDYIKKCITVLTGQVALTQEDQNLKLQKMTELNKLLDETDEDREKMYGYYNVKSSTEMTISQLEDAIKKLGGNKQ